MCVYYFHIAHTHTHTHSQCTYRLAAYAIDDDASDFLFLLKCACACACITEPFNGKTLGAHVFTHHNTDGRAGDMRAGVRVRAYVLARRSRARSQLKPNREMEVVDDDDGSVRRTTLSTFRTTTPAVPRSTSRQWHATFTSPKCAATHARTLHCTGFLFFLLFASAAALKNKCAAHVFNSVWRARSVVNRKRARSKCVCMWHMCVHTHTHTKNSFLAQSAPCRVRINYQYVWCAGASWFGNWNGETNDDDGKWMQR